MVYGKAAHAGNGVSSDAGVAVGTEGRLSFSGLSSGSLRIPLSNSWKVLRVAPDT